MNKNGPIVIIEDDEDDRDLYMDAFKLLNYQNELIFFNSAAHVIDFLRTDVHPFLIISDVNMPIQNGFGLREEIQKIDSLRAKTIPYLFMSTSVSPEMVNTAYEMPIQGYFLKPNEFSNLTDMLGKIIDYWVLCYSPASYI